VTDDPARSGTTEPEIPGEGQVAQPHLQLTERIASPLEAGHAIERPDELGRIPVVVRVLRQPPIQPIALAVAAALGTLAVLVPAILLFTVLLVVGAVAAIVVGLLARLILRVPPTAVGLVTKGNRHWKILEPGIHLVPPVVVLTHLITRRQVAFDVPVRQVRSSEGVGVDVDVILTLRVADPVTFAYAISTSDADQLVQAVALDSVRSLIRGIGALQVLDLGGADADRLREAIDARLSPFGLLVTAAAFTRVQLPAELTASLEAQRLAAIQVAEQAEQFALQQRRLTDEASLIAQEEDLRRAAVEFEATAEAIRLSMLEERVTANPIAARYDLELERLKVARKLARNGRVVVSVNGSDLVTDLLTAAESGATREPARRTRASAGGSGAAKPGADQPA
jgi:regulator of protease activity HflC (stomatin/prohibitin superfamily)